MPLSLLLPKTRGPTGFCQGDGDGAQRRPIWLIFYYPAGLDFHKKICYNIKKDFFRAALRAPPDRTPTGDAARSYYL